MSFVFNPSMLLPFFQVSISTALPSISASIPEIIALDCFKIMYMAENLYSNDSDC
jgi:hypothetical protein